MPSNNAIKYDMAASDWNAPADLGNSAAQMALGQNSNGELEIFFAGTDNGLYNLRQNVINSSVWAGQGRFGGTNSAKQVAVGQNASGQLEIFYVGADNVKDSIGNAPAINLEGSNISGPERYR